MQDISSEAQEPQPRYVVVHEVDYEPVVGCRRTQSKSLLSTERLEIRQFRIAGPGPAEDYGVCATQRAAYVLSGTAALKQEGAAELELRKGHLVVIPAGARWASQLSVRSDELVLLEVTARVDGAPVPSTTAMAQVRRVDPAEVQPYAPAGHAKTQNRCLFADAHLEIIEGRIDRGGGAERHAHADNEQLLYVLSGAGTPLLIHYPKCAPHGTGGGVPEPLELLVIYSPPLGEAHNALA